MKKTILLLALGSLLFANLSFVGMPVMQAQAQSTSGTSISSVISTIISIITDIFGGGDKKYKSPVRTGYKDCHNELVYYYKVVVNDDGTIDELPVGYKEVKFGEVVHKAPMTYDTYVLEYYSENESNAKIECIGESTSTYCTERSLTCAEQNP